jgi:hypothetical protein
MSNVVDFLEALSVDARALSEGGYLQAVAKAGFDAATQRALLMRDMSALNAALGARATVLAFVFPAEDEPDTEQPDTDDPDREPKEGHHDSHSASLAA